MNACLAVGHTAILLLGLAQKAHKSPLPGPAPSACQAACLHIASSQPAQQEAGQSPGQLVLVTLYLTQSMLLTRNWSKEPGGFTRPSWSTTAGSTASGLLWALGSVLCGLGHRSLLGLTPPTSICPHPPFILSCWRAQRSSTSERDSTLLERHQAEAHICCVTLSKSLALSGP